MHEDLIGCGHELAAIFLPEPPVTHVPPLLVEKCRRDAWARGRRDLDALPLGAAVLPRLEEVAPLAEWGRHENEPVTGDGEHGPHRITERVVDPRRLGFDGEWWPEKQQPCPQRGGFLNLRISIILK